MKACQQCRQAKRKCVRSRTDLLAPCSRCRQQALACSSSISRQRRGEQNLAMRQISPPGTFSCVSTGLVEAFLADQKAVAMTVQDYLTKIHDRPHSIFHTNTLWRDIRMGTIPRHLLLAICAMGSHVSNRAAVRKLEPLLTSEAKQLLKEDLENPSVQNVQACILVGNLCAAHINPSSEFFFFRAAITMLQLMDFATEMPTDNAITQEVKVRVWWALFMADNWCCSSLNLPCQMKDCPQPSRLPLDEELFQALQSDEPSSLLQSRKVPGLWGHMVTLVELFASIQELNHRVVQDKSLAQDQIEELTNNLAQQLDDWQFKLPVSDQLTESNLLNRASRGTGGAFLALHLGFYHYATLLYYQYLDTEYTPTPLSRIFAARCKKYALGYSTLLSRGRKQDRCEAIYPTVGQMTIVSSSVLLHTLLFGDPEESAQSHHCLEANFEALLDLKRYWPFIETMIDRLMNFQKTLLLLSHSHTHSLDRWMVRFLFEYSLPLEDKTSNPPHLTADLEIIPSRAQFFSRIGRLTTFGDSIET